MDRQKSRKWTIRLTAGLVLFAAGFGLGRLSQGNSTVAEGDGDAPVLTDTESQMEAAVVRRVSQQMEDIATQQLAISDQQRNRAERQSALAIEMRDRAEQESSLARQAERRAIAAASEAEAERAKALEHQAEAERRRDEAEHQKRLSDTLSTAVISRNLAKMSLQKYESGDIATSAKLAYVSWYLLNDINANTFQPDLFKALLNNSNTSKTIAAANGGGGAITAHCTMPDGQILAVTDYGEVSLYNPDSSERQVLIDNPELNFRSLAVDSASAYALTIGGPLYTYGYDGSTTVIDIPMDLYQKVICLDSHKLLLVADNSIYVLDVNKKVITSSRHFDAAISTLIKTDAGINVYFKNSSAVSIDEKLATTDTTICPSDDYVTAALIDVRSQIRLLGTQNGNIHIYNADDELIATLTGHKSAITCLDIKDGIAVSGSFDKTVRVWSLKNLLFSDGSVLEANFGTGIVPDWARYRQNDVTAEWLVAPAIQLKSWPLTLCRTTGNGMAAGCSDGTVQLFDVSVDDMARSVKQLYPESLTPQEWKEMVGLNVPYNEI